MIFKCITENEILNNFFFSIYATGFNFRKKGSLLYRYIEFMDGNKLFLVNLKRSIEIRMQTNWHNTNLNKFI